MPRLKSSSSSRARFSLGCPLRLAGASSQIKQCRVAHRRLQQLAEGRAGQSAEQLVLAPHGRRIVDLRLLVAKWLCHMSVNRSPSGSGEKSIR